MTTDPTPPTNGNENLTPDEQPTTTSTQTIILKYGLMNTIAELKYSSNDLPQPGTKFVISTPRGVEIGTMLSSTCDDPSHELKINHDSLANYIELSGEKQFPFTKEGKILRIASREDLNEQAHIDTQKKHYLQICGQLIEQVKLPIKLIEVEALLGGDRLIYYFMSESRVDFRELVKNLASEFHTRIEMRQIGARDESRLVADYEKCGQPCCCRQFLKVLRPISMRLAKTQKATLDPTKISGRCGRLMCCLKYEDVVYEELRKRLPSKAARVLTPEGPGHVINSQIITQLVLVEMESDHRRVAYPVEDITKIDKNFVWTPPPANTYSTSDSYFNNDTQNQKTQQQPEKNQSENDKPKQTTRSRNNTTNKSNTDTSKQKQRSNKPATESKNNNNTNNTDTSKSSSSKRRRRRRRKKKNNNSNTNTKPDNNPT